MSEIKRKIETDNTPVLYPRKYRAIDVRSQMITVPEVVQALTPIERRIFEASIKTPVADIQDEELAPKVGLMAKYIAKDAGIKNVDDYEVARFLTVLKSYYSSFSLQEIMLAFELAIIGKLDEFMPIDKHGNPDKNHYQTFNTGYISKILNAYKKFRSEIECKAYIALPEPQNITGQKTKDYYRREMKRTVIDSFLAYKYRGALPDDLTPFLIYDEIDRLGLAEPIQVTEVDKKEAVARLLKKANAGLIKEFVAACIRHLKTEHHEVIAEAGLIAKEKALIKSFEVMAKEEIQITDYIRLK